MLNLASTARRRRRRSMTKTQLDETDRVRGIFDELAPSYDRVMDWGDRILFRGGREWLARQASGEVLEVGVGTGRTIPSFPRSIRLTGIDISPRMLDRAKHRAATLGLGVDLRVGDAQALEFPDDSFDTVLFSLALCSIPDDRRAIAEASRVLRPGGRVALLEHVRSLNASVRAVQRLLDPLAVRFQGDHLLREPADLLKAEGLVLEDLRRSRWGIVERVVAHKRSPT
jgi:ubiquinone/menaquinone biosynthesis C-methylase UbiE